MRETQNYQILELLEAEVSGGGTSPARGVDVVVYTPADQ